MRIGIVGAGALGTVALAFLYPLRLSTERLVATDIAQALPLALLAASGHAALGHTDWALLGSLLLGSVPGVLLGTAMMFVVPQIFTELAQYRYFAFGIAMILIMVLRPQGIWRLWSRTSGGSRWAG